MPYPLFVTTDKNGANVVCVLSLEEHIVHLMLRKRSLAVIVLAHMLHASMLASTATKTMHTPRS
eukprot:2237933-Lingulodinium_polyedra.AAC.1